MSSQLDIFEEVAEQMAYAQNVGMRGNGRGARTGVRLCVSPGLSHAKVAREVPLTPATTAKLPADSAGAPEAIPASVPRVVTDRDELVELIRRRRDELNISHETIDALTGWASGYTSKLLAPEPMKGFGEGSLRLVLGALALGIARIEFVDDPEQAARMRARWVRRKRRPTHHRGALLAKSLQEIVASTTEPPDVETQPEFPSQTRACGCHQGRGD